MNTKLLMTINSIIMGLAGILLTFMPDEIIKYVTITSGTKLDVLMLQLLGALYFGFAMINWTAKANLIGGIYSRPVAIGNLIHFTVGALALLKGYSSGYPLIIQVATIIYTVFAILFAIVFFRHPVADK
jgi:hypothetical protein